MRPAVPICSACRTRVRRGASYCDACGSSIVSKAAGTTRVRPPSGRVYALGVAAVVVIAIALVAALGSQGASNTGPSTSALWQAKLDQLGNDTVQYRAATGTGDANGAAKATQHIATDCQGATLMQPDTSDAHGKVQSLCSTIGVSVP